MQTTTKKTSIGGQALIEGIMMRGPKKTSMSVRLPDKTIDTDTWDTYPNGTPPSYKKFPFVRGIFNMIDTLALGFKCLMASADKAGMEEEEPTKFEKWLAKTFRVELNKIVGAMAVVLGVGLAALLFIVVPTALTSLLRPVLGEGNLLFTLVEGAIKIAVFLIYLFLCSRSKEMARVFSYHGAEHKTIACYEAGEELTVENCRKYTRFHPRCGTSFLLIVLVVSILLFSIVPSMNPLLRMVLKLAMLPLVIGIAYEFIKLAGRYDNACSRILSAPGIWLQRLTTNEPDDSMLEVSIAAMQAVIPESENEDRW